MMIRKDIGYQERVAQNSVAINIFRSYLPENKEYKYFTNFSVRLSKELNSGYLWGMEMESRSRQMEGGRGRDRAISISYSSLSLRDGIIL